MNKMNDANWFNDCLEVVVTEIEIAFFQRKTYFETLGNCKLDSVHQCIILSWEKRNQNRLQYSCYYKPPLYLFLRLFGAASIQEFVHFPSFSIVKLHFDAASIQEGLIFERGL